MSSQNTIFGSHNVSANSKYQHSAEALVRALKTIPAGSQTFSKSYLHLPRGVSPLMIERGQDARFWDVDGNEFVDVCMGLAAVTLGYCDEYVDTAVSKQITRGITHSLPTMLEAEVAERVVDIVPCAEQVRFAKNGSDATSSAIRLARAYTGRMHIIACGYHGWHDWYIGSTTRHLGVPDTVRSLTHSVSANDISQLSAKLDELHDDVAAVILEPMMLETPIKTLQEIRNLCNKKGVLLVFDEVITGMRFEGGSAQKLYGVTPDLTSLGKGLGNGMPISAITGPEEILRLMNDIFFSGTFGGEALSLAAANEVLRRVQEEAVLDQIANTGRSVIDACNTILQRREMTQILQILNEPSLPVFSFSENEIASLPEIKTFFLAGMMAEGVFSLGTMNFCASFSQEDQTQLIAAFDRTIERLSLSLQKGTLADDMPCPVIEPVFQLRKS